MEHPLCEMVQKHNREIGEVNTSIKGMEKTLESMNKVLQNGWKDEVNKTLVEFKLFVDQLREVQEEEKLLKSDVLELKKDSWILRIFDTTTKKIVGIIILYTIVNALTSAGTWGFIKAYWFKETPKLMQTISQDMHIHKLPNGTYLVHGHQSPDGDPISVEQQILK